MIKNIIFDMGNVLVDFCWEEAFHKLGLEGETFRRVADATVRNYDWNEFDLANIPHEEIINKFVENDPEMEAEIRHATESYEGLIKKRDYSEELIKKLQRAGYGVYILSNMSPEAFMECGDEMLCAKLADGAVYSCDCHMVKPDRRIYELLLEKYNLDAAECVFLDDKLENIEGGEAVGIKGIVFKNIDDAINELNRMGVNF